MLLAQQIAITSTHDMIKVSWNVVNDADASAFPCAADFPLSVTKDNIDRVIAQSLAIRQSAVDLAVAYAVPLTISPEDGKLVTQDVAVAEKAAIAAPETPL